MPTNIPKDHPKTLDEYLKREAEIRASVWYAQHLAGETHMEVTHRQMEQEYSRQSRRKSTKKEN